MIISGTGHRPVKLIYQGRNAYDPQVYARLVKLAEAAIKHYKPKKVISGMALGWDQALCEAALTLGIPVLAAVPFLGQESRWPKASQEKYHELLAQVEEIVYVSPGGYAAFKMQVRNVYMTDHADLVLALWDGSVGGTGNCVGHVQKHYPEKLVNLWDKWQPTG